MLLPIACGFALFCHVLQRLQRTASALLTVAFLSARFVRESPFVMLLLPDLQHSSAPALPGWSDY